MIWYGIMAILKLCYLLNFILLLYSSEFYSYWNANLQSFARAKSETKMAAHGGKFCTSASVLFADLYVGSIPLHYFNLRLLFGSASKTFITMGKVLRQNIAGPVLHNRVFKRIHYCHMA